MILGLLGALAKLADQVMSLFREQALRQAGADAHRLETHKETLDEIKIATAARAAVERAVVLEPGRLRDDDGFRRPD